MATTTQIITDVTAVEFVESRWDVTIRVTLVDGTVREWVASADSAYTCNDGIRFGTDAEYQEAQDAL